MQEPVYIYQGSLSSIGQKFTIDIDNGDAWYELNFAASKILVGQTLIKVSNTQIMQLIRSSILYGHMDENTYREWYNKQLLDRNPTAPVMDVQPTQSDTLTDFGGLAALGVKIQRH